MIASRFKKDHQNQLLGRRRCYVAPIHCLGPRSPLSFVLKLLFFAQCTRAQHLVKRTALPHLFSTPNLIVASRINLLQPGDWGETMEQDVHVVVGLMFSPCWHLRKQLLHSWCRFYCNFAFSPYIYIVNRGQYQLFVVRNVRISGVTNCSCSWLGTLCRLD